MPQRGRFTTVIGPTAADIIELGLSPTDFLTSAGLAEDPDNPPAPVAVGEHVSPMYDRNGRQVVYIATRLDSGNDSVSLGADPAVIGCDTYFNSNLLAAAVAAKSGAGRLYGIQFYNPSNAVAFVQLFDLAAGSVVLATTVPKLAFGVATLTNSLPFIFNPPITFAAAISLAGTTTATGNSAPNAGLIANLWLK